MNSYNIMHADSLEVSWKEFVGDGNVFVFANPPFTNGNTGKFLGFTGLEEIQKTQLKRYGLGDNLDIAFLCKSSEEGFDNGLWIVNATAPYRQYKVLNKLNMHIEISDAKTGKEIISSGSQPERWLTVTPGTTNIYVIKSSKSLTGWCNTICAASSYKIDYFDVPIPGSVEVSYYKYAKKGKRCWSTNPAVLPEGHTYYNIGAAYFTPEIIAIKAPANYFAGGPRVIVDPSEWVLSVLKSRVLYIWGKTVEINKNPTGLLAAHLLHTFNTFPLYEGDDLSFFDGMSDDEIREELLKRYNSLVQ